MAIHPNRLDRLTQRSQRLREHIDDPNSTPLESRREEWKTELKSIIAELAGEQAAPAGTVVDVPVGNMSANT